jgi:hypothetical protein
MLGDHQHGGGCFPFRERINISFLPSRRGEVMEMEFTLEEVIGIVTVIFIILTYINSIYKKK